MSAPWFKFWANDWLGSIRVDRMTAEEEATYLRMLLVDWNGDGLPAEIDHILASLKRFSTKEMVERLLAQFFEQRPDGTWTHLKLDEQRGAAEERRRRAREAAQARWSAQGNAPRTPPSTAQGNAIPEPEPEPETKATPEPESPVCGEFQAQLEEVLACYRRHHPKFPDAAVYRKEHRLIAERIQDGYSVEDLCRAIEGYHVSPYHRGENANGTKYLHLSLMVRDAEQVEKGWAYLEAASGQSKNGVGEKSWTTLMSWMGRKTKPAPFVDDPTCRRAIELVWGSTTRMLAAAESWKGIEGSRKDYIAAYQAASR